MHPHKLTGKFDGHVSLILQSFPREELSGRVLDFQVQFSGEGKTHMEEAVREIRTCLSLRTSLVISRL